MTRSCRRFAAVLIALMLAACGGGGGGGSSPGPGGGTGSAADDPNKSALALAATVPDGVTVDQTTLLGSQRIDRVTIEYTYSVQITNHGSGDLQSVTATVTSSAPTTLVTDADLTFGDLAARATTTSTDTFTIRQDRTAPLSDGNLSITVAGTSPVPPSSAQLIQRALDNGAINDETALVYRVYAMFGDPRLPAQYRGDDSGVIESGALADANERYDLVSPATQDLLRPFLTRPEDAGSWWNGGAGAGAATRAQAQAVRVQPHAGAPSRRFCLINDPDWLYIDTATAKVRVWYNRNEPDDPAVAQFLADEMENVVWPKLIGALQFKEPISDVNYICNGGDGRLDIYLVDLANLGDTIHDAFSPYSSATYILIRRTLINEDLKHALSHEFTHAIHYAYTTSSFQLSYGWFRDAFANWGTDQAYPPTDPAYNPKRERSTLWKNASCHFKSPHVSQDDESGGYCTGSNSLSRNYGSYLLLQFLERTLGTGTVKTILEKTQMVSTGLEAMDTTVSGGFKEQWPKYARALWNQGPVKPQGDSFKSWDDLDDKPVRTQEIDARLQGRPYAETELEDKVANVSSKYYVFNFFDGAQYDPSDPAKPLPPPDAETRSVLFHNTFYDNWKAGQKVSVRVLYKPENGLPWVEDDWTKYEWIGLCRDVKAERLQQLVIIVGSGESTGSNPTVDAAQKPKLMRNNIGCWGYQGTTTTRYNDKQWTQGGYRTVTSHVYFDAHAGPTFTDPTEYLRVPITSGPLFRFVDWQLDESYTEDKGCHHEAHKSGTNGPSSSTFGLTLINYFKPDAIPLQFRFDQVQALGNDERRYFISGGTNVTVAGTVSNCPPDDNGDVPPSAPYETNVAIWLLAPVEPPKMPKVDRDGHLRFSWVTSQPSDSYVQSFTWDLTPLREP